MDRQNLAQLTQQMVDEYARLQSYVVHTKEIAATKFLSATQVPICRMLDLLRACKVVSAMLVEHLGINAVPQGYAAH